MVLCLPSGVCAAFIHCCSVVAKTWLGWTAREIPRTGALLMRYAAC